MMITTRREFLTLCAAAAAAFGFEVSGTSLGQAAPKWRRLVGIDSLSNIGNGVEPTRTSLLRESTGATLLTWATHPRNDYLWRACPGCEFVFERADSPIVKSQSRLRTTFLFFDDHTMEAWQDGRMERFSLIAC